MPGLKTKQAGLEYRVISRGAAPTNQDAPLLTVTDRQEITTARMGSQWHAVVHSIHCSALGVACPLQKSGAAIAKQRYRAVR